MKFIIGIGNPGLKYDKTRHNIGFRALDGLTELYETRLEKRFKRSRKFGAEIYTAQKAVFIKPETYVNRTGDAAAAILREYQAQPSDFLFLCDDVNLVFGKLRLRRSGSAGGHHGLESVIEAFGTKDFPRLRIGVGSAQMPQDDLTDFVLGKFSKDEEKSIGPLLENVVLVCNDWIDGGFTAAANRLSRLQC